MDNFLEKMMDLLDTKTELTLDTRLDDIEEWDSLSIVSFAAMSYIEYGKKLVAPNIKNAKTIRDLFILINGE